MAPVDAIGVILTSHEQGSALIFKVCFLGGVSKDLWVAGASGAAQGRAAAVSLMESSRRFLWFTVGCYDFHKVRGDWRKSPPNTDSKAENWCKNDISFLRKG